MIIFPIVFVSVVVGFAIASVVAFFTMPSEVWEGITETLNERDENATV